jgi:hypothetical protein
MFITDPETIAINLPAGFKFEVECWAGLAEWSGLAGWNWTFIFASTSVQKVNDEKYWGRIKEGLCQ